MKRKTVKNQLYVILMAALVFCIAVVAVVSLTGGGPGEEVKAGSSDNAPKALIRFENTAVKAFVANTEESRAKGLSGAKPLAPDGGMVFLFSDYSPRNFWMKDMNYPLDILFINDDKIADMAENVPVPKQGASDELIPRASTDKKVNIVLEVNAGFIKKHGIKTGDLVKITLESR